MDHRPTAAGQAPTPGPIRLRDRYRVARHGRRDARRGLSAQPDAPQPYLVSLRADAEAGQRAVTAWLHDKITPVDHEAVQLLTVLEQYRRRPASPPATPARKSAADAHPQPASSIPGWVLDARAAAAEQRAFERRLCERDAAEQALSQLGSRRRHLVEVARSAARAHTCRYEQLAALYYAVLLRHGANRNRAGEGCPVPSVRSEAWVDGDLPLLALEIDTDLAERYRWVLRQFETSTSAAQGLALETSSSTAPAWGLSTGE